MVAIGGTHPGLTSLGTQAFTLITDLADELTDRLRSTPQNVDQITWGHDSNGGAHLEVFTRGTGEAWAVQALLSLPLGGWSVTRAPATPTDPLLTGPVTRGRYATVRAIADAVDTALTAEN